MSDDDDLWPGGAHDASRRERRAPICPACGVTALPQETSDPDGGFRCENPDCELFDQPI